MNKVYKVIWSKARNCYVVASELAKSYTKLPASGVMSTSVVAGVLACVLSCGAVMPVMAAGNASNINADNNNAVTGADIYAYLQQLQLALGADSVANVANTVSVGKSASGDDPQVTRRIVNVADGTSATDVATVGQTIELENGINSVVTADGTNSIGQSKYKIDVVGNGSVASGNTGLISGDTLFAEGRVASNGNYVQATNTIAQNLTALDTQVKTVDDRTHFIGIHSTATSNSNYNGEGAVGLDTIAIGKNASAGSSISADMNSGGSIALGSAANAAHLATIAIGLTATSSNIKDVAIGGYSFADGGNSVALGYGSRATVSNVVSVGNGGYSTTGPSTRRIINVANGINDTDAVVMSQLNAEITARSTGDTNLGNRIGTVADGTYNFIQQSSSKNTAENLILLDTALKTTNDTVSANKNEIETSLAGEVSARQSADTALDGRIGTLSANGNYIKKSATNNVSANLTVLDYQLKATNDNLAGYAEDINRNKASIASLNSSVTAALGSVSSTSTLVSTLDGLKADASLNNLTVAGRNVIAAAAANAVQEYMAAQQGTNIESPVAPMMYNANTLNVTNAGNGSLYVGEGSNVNGSQSIAIGVGNQVNANNSGAFGDPSIINADESYVLGNDDTINTGATGSFVVGNDSVSSAKGGLTFGSNNNLEETAENSVALGNNVSVSGRNSVALGSGSTAVDDNVISVGNDTLKRKITNVANGNIAEDSTDAVTGSQLFATNERVKANEDAIATKANLDASNIDVDSWTAKLGTGAVESSNTGLVNGGTVFTAIQKIQDNQLIQQDGDTLHIGSTVGGNTISVANSAGEGRVITGVATDPTNPYSATNVGYVQSVSENIINAVNNSISKVDSKVNKVGANAAALASLTPASFEGDEKWSLAASFGHYEGETAGAVGAFYKPTENVMLNLRGSFASGENMFGGGVAVSLSKGDVPGVTKRQMAVTINKQASAINELQQNQQVILQEREQDKQLISNILQAREQDQKRIAELEAMVQKMAKQMNAGK